MIFHERLDAVSQVIRLSFLNSSKQNNSDFDIRKIKKLINLLLKYQNSKSNNIKIKGSFYWGKTSNGKQMKHPNSWVTFFAIQALFMYRNYANDQKLKIDSFDLV